MPEAKSERRWWQLSRRTLKLGLLGGAALLEWNKPQPDLGEIAGVIESGEMPPLQYTLIHRSARLSSSEKKKLVAAITHLYATDPPPGGGG